MGLVSKAMQWSKGISVSWANGETALLKSHKHTCFSWIKRERKGNSTIKDNWLTLFLSESNLFKYAVNLFLNLDDSAQLRGALFQNSLTCCVRFLHHLPAGPSQFHISNGNPQLPQIQSYRATVSGRPKPHQLSAAGRSTNESGVALETSTWEIQKICRAPDLSPPCLVTGKDTHLKWHPGHRILLWTEDSWWPFAPAVHICLLCHYSSVIGHTVGRIPVEFWDLDFWGIMVIWLHGKRLHFLL